MTDLTQIMALTRSQLRLLSQRAYEASLGLFTSREFPSHEVSYARTVVGFNMRSSDDHRMPCNACNKVHIVRFPVHLGIITRHQRITGIRYQCASCPSTPGSIYNLVSHSIFFQPRLSPMRLSSAKAAKRPLILFTTLCTSSSRFLDQSSAPWKPPSL